MTDDTSVPVSTDERLNAIQVRMRRMGHFETPIKLDTLASAEEANQRAIVVEILECDAPFLLRLCLNLRGRVRELEAEAPSLVSVRTPARLAEIQTRLDLFFGLETASTKPGGKWHECSEQCEDLIRQDLPYLLNLVRDLRERENDLEAERRRDALNRQAAMAAANNRVRKLELERDQAASHALAMDARAEKEIARMQELAAMSATMCPQTITKTVRPPLVITEEETYSGPSPTIT